MQSAANSTRFLKLKKLHVLKREHGLEDDAYRDRLERLTGKRSAKDCSDAELDRALAAFHVKQSAAHPHAAKVKALFIAAFNLGAFEHGSDAALDAFVARQTGKERLAFVTAVEANSITEALKGICEREGFVVPKDDDGGTQARRALLRAQWNRLWTLRAVKIASEDALNSWISHRIVPRRESHRTLKRHELDAAAIALGRWIRRAKADKRASAKSSK